MKKINIKITSLLLIAAVPFLSFASGRADEIEVQNYNTVRIAGNTTESNNIDPEENKRILPYILKEDLLDLLAGGIVVTLPDENNESSEVLSNLRSRDFNPTVYVYYSNDTKQADTECYYQGEELIYYSRSAYSASPFQKIGMTAEEKTITTEYSQEDIAIHFSVYPLKEINRDTAEYGAFCSFFHLDDDSMSDLFNDAKVTLNGMSLKNREHGFFRLNGSNPVFKTGEIISIEIEHELFGEIRKEMSVPAPMDSFSVEPELKGGIPNQTDNYRLNWEQQDCTAYDLIVYRADEKGDLDSYGKTVEDLQYQWDPWELNEKGKPVPYLRFAVNPSNMFKPEGFSEWSEISVLSPSPSYYGNFLQ
ncbi:MAG: hypothetical protein JXR86_16275 [Spirochaetales bacterium]|nr:hypothetical protein [Spirochaetales bacterium]